MRFEIDPFENYFASATDTKKELLDSDSPLVAGLRTYHDFFVEYAFDEQLSMLPVQCLLTLHAFMMYLGSMRVTFSGHPATRVDSSVRAAAWACCDSIRHRAPQPDG